MKAPITKIIAAINNKNNINRFLFGDYLFCMHLFWKEQTQDNTAEQYPYSFHLRPPLLLPYLLLLFFRLLRLKKTKF